MKQAKVILLLGSLFSFGVVPSGCENVALVGRPTLGPGTGIENIEFIADVEGLNTRQQQIYVRTEEGRSRVLKYNANTRVTIEGREHPVRDLRMGDRVAMQIRDDFRGQDYTDLIRVRKRDFGRHGAGRNKITVLEGTVEHVNDQRGFFELRPGFGDLLRVRLPYNPPRQVEEKFYRIRSGDYVRVEGEMVGEDRLILKAFL